VAGRNEAHLACKSRSRESLDGDDVECGRLICCSAATLTLEDVASLRHFSREQIKLTMFLGSGAFGEVFEGVATNILSENSGNTKVAVKVQYQRVLFC